MTPPPKRYCGWYRPQRGIRWTKLVSAATYAAAWEQLLDATAMTRGGELLVVFEQTDANTGRRRRKATATRRTTT